MWRPDMKHGSIEATLLALEFHLKRTRVKAPPGARGSSSGVSFLGLLWPRLAVVPPNLKQPQQQPQTRCHCDFPARGGSIQTPTTITYIYAYLGLCTQEEKRNRRRRLDACLEHVQLLCSIQSLNQTVTRVGQMQTKG